ncbi:helix-turn-helix transcriptional regulator [Metaclostridioides mangenotii]|uniref:helix-turn-helix domain-containing protein n=1 Tax=Metaclostridioides mangenotii TaxID=1540 RepID=UPI0028E2884D|nr:helix-turn-helix transcriptional regulator [Clostridioides mangenotii]
MCNEISLGEKIKVARTKKGLKQSELSSLLGVRNTAISGWENNQSKPDINMLESLCKILEIQPNYFFNLEDNDSITLEELDLIKKFRLLDSRGKHITKSVIDIELESSRNN